MRHRIRNFVVMAIAMALLVPVAVAQKPPAPAPPPSPSAPPSRPATPAPSSSQPGQPELDLVMFLMGRVATSDGAAVPNDVLVERVCNASVRQQVHATSRGDFSMQMGSMADSVLDASASGDRASQDDVASKASRTGISRRELANCELRASASGFRSSVISLVDLDSFGSSIDVGAIVVRRATKIEGMTLSATPYKAPKDARKAYEKGVQAEKSGNLADAHKYFENAVNLYPNSANTWFQFGLVLEKENQPDAARKAYTQATTIDTRFLPPYLSLASIAYQAGNWPEVLDLTGHILNLDPMNRVAANNYILDLDPMNYADAYFYNAMASYKLNKIEDAEKSGLKAELLDVRPRFPQLHLLLAEIFARKNNYATAISELKIYLELAPHAKNADQVREWLAKLEKLNGPVSSSEKTDQK